VLNLEKKQCTNEVGQLKKVITLQTAMTKKVVSFFSGKKGMMPSVAAPGDTNVSDVTGRTCHSSGQMAACSV